MLYGINFHKIGKLVKIRGVQNIQAGHRISIGDFCWVETINNYAGEKFTPSLKFGNNVSLSDFVHISCAAQIDIGDNCLIGSRVYIGDHSHGNPSDTKEILNVSPAKRPLGNISSISIGDNSWICDGAVILAGAKLASHSIIGANSVVKLQTNRPALIAGAPAKVIRYLD